MNLYRTRFKKEIVAEFLPPRRARGKLPKENKVIVLCGGHPGTPSKPQIVEFWAKKGYWVFNPRYRGSWESSGRFLRYSPEKDVLDIIDSLPRGFTEAFAHKKFRVRPDAIYIFGTSFGGAAAILASRDPRVTKVVAVSPVVDWKARSSERIDWSYNTYSREAFGEAYRLSRDGAEKLKSGKFYNPAAHIDEIDGKKILIVHAKDDDVVRFRPVARFAKLVGANTMFLKRGGHGASSWYIKPRFYKRIAKFLKSR